jgi:hypothetical protein
MRDTQRDSRPGIPVVAGRSGHRQHLDRDLRAQRASCQRVLLRQGHPQNPSHTGENRNRRHRGSIKRGSRRGVGAADARTGRRSVGWAPPAWRRQSNSWLKASASTPGAWPVPRRVEVEAGGGATRFVWHSTRGDSTVNACLRSTWWAAVEPVNQGDASDGDRGAGQCGGVGRDRARGAPGGRGRVRRDSRAPGVDRHREDVDRGDQGHRGRSGTPGRAAGTRLLQRRRRAARRARSADPGARHRRGHRCESHRRGGADPAGGTRLAPVPHRAGPNR